MARSLFKLTPHQQLEADQFIHKHANECEKVSKEARAFAETEEQATITSSYGYSFVDMGIADDCKIFCTLCKQSKTLSMSQQELEDY